MRADLPTGTVTFLFTDIEGSTRLIDELGEGGFLEALAEHRRLLREAFGAHGGVEVDTQGDAFLYAFADAGAALAAAANGQQALVSGPVRVRMGLHTGEPLLSAEGYAGRELHRAARIAASGHGGQLVISAATAALVDGELIELGEHRLKDFDEPMARRPRAASGAQSRLHARASPLRSTDSVLHPIQERPDRCFRASSPAPTTRSKNIALCRRFCDAPGMNRTCARGLGSQPRSSTHVRLCPLSPS